MPGSSERSDGRMVGSNARAHFHENNGLVFRMFHRGTGAWGRRLEVSGQSALLFLF
jgi:hypothetical protein